MTKRGFQLRDLFSREEVAQLNSLQPQLAMNGAVTRVEKFLHKRQEQYARVAGHTKDGKVIRPITLHTELKQRGEAE